MKIVIFSGGSGSVALQRGLHQSLVGRFDGIETTILVNAYDNGLSTGAVRRVMDRKILGPSDVRKNQATRLRLMRPNDPWIGFLDRRFTARAAQAHQSCRNDVTNVCKQLHEAGTPLDDADLLYDAVDEYFSSPHAAHVAYEDFSIANVVYAGIARQNHYSLRSAARIMAGLMRIPDCVILNDDQSLFLGATTRSGARVTDEGEIVSWGDESDPFVEVFFEDPEGNESRPTLCLEAWEAIIAADLIILSSGTPWSSLIPTYASIGFKDAIRASQAKVIMVMNRVPDKDTAGQTASDIVNILVPRYFDRDRLHALLDKNGHPSLGSLNGSAAAKTASWMRTDLSSPADPWDKHNPGKLAHAIGRVLFQPFLDSDLFLFDYDDTLFGRRGRFPTASRFNINAIARLNELTNVAVCTGNSIQSLDLTSDADVSTGHGTERKPLTVFADGGVNLYLCQMHNVAGYSNGRTPVKCIAPDVLLPTTGALTVGDVIESLQAAGIPASNIDNRGNALISIKPVARERRDALIRMARSMVGGSDLLVRRTGTTTVEIRGRKLSKVHAIHYIFMQPAAPSRITYIGDECESGNDADISQLAQREPRIACLRVRDPAMTAFFIATLVNHLNRHA